MSRKRHVRFLAAYEHTEQSTAEYLKARFGRFGAEPACPTPNREARRKARMRKRVDRG